jgi:predicted O-linked N-acetylglucosamine transferase (SPINDLY family)
MSVVGRNKPCPCGSGKKNKYCCGKGVTANSLQPAPVVSYQHGAAVGETLTPAHAEKLNEQGNAYVQQGRFDEAIACYEKALAINPYFAGALNNLGLTYKDMGQLDRAISCYRQGLDWLAPTYAMTCNNLGISLKEQGKHEEAIACYRQALELMPDSVEVNTNLGNVLYDRKLFSEAVVCFRKVLEHGPEVPIINKLGYALHSIGNFSEALDFYKQSLELVPDSAVMLFCMAVSLNCQGRIDEAIVVYRQALTIDPGYIQAHGGLIMTLLYSISANGEELLAEACRFAGMFETPLRAGWSTAEHVQQSGDRLRVGLVSADLRHHSVGYFLDAVLHQIDREAFSLIAYANHENEDSLSEQLKPCFDTWINVSSLSDEQMSERIKADGIDLLVDLSGHSLGNRLLVFARKPAPVQATWLGYPSTTGLQSMDFIIADAITLPPEEERYYSEKAWRLPETYICFTPPEIDVAPAPLPMLKNGFITFGCFNNPSKINNSVIACWADILNALPDAVLLLKNKCFDHEPERDRFRHRFSTCGVIPDRLKFIGALSRQDHLAAYHYVDMALDPFPYNGVTTTCEALWMGVPTLTMRMTRGMYGHNGELIMKMTGLDDWVTESVEAYRDRAVAFAANPEWLATLRTGLREALLSSSLCAPDRFARNLEDAFRGMIRTKVNTGLLETT